MAAFSCKKDPNALRKYTISWSRWLASQSDGEQLDGSEWIVPEGLTLVQEAFDTTKVVLWLSGGTLGATYQVVNRITTNIGQIEDATIEIFMEEK